MKRLNMNKINLHEMFRNEFYDLEKLFDEFDDERKVEFIEKYPFIWNDVFDIDRNSRYHRAMKEIIKAGYTAALNDLQPKVEKLIDALEYYAAATSWAQVYSNDYGNVSVLLNENDYDWLQVDDIESEYIGGKLARKSLAEFKHDGEKQLTKPDQNVNNEKLSNEGER